MSSRVSPSLVQECFYYLVVSGTGLCSLYILVRIVEHLMSHQFWFPLEVVHLYHQFGDFPCVKVFNHHLVMQDVVIECRKC